MPTPAPAILPVPAPATIVPGRYDVVCPMRSAWDLHRAWPEAELIVNARAGHSMFDPELYRTKAEVAEWKKRDPIGLLMERLFLRSEGFEYLRNGLIALGLAILIALAIGRWNPLVTSGWIPFVAVTAIATIALYFLLTRIPIIPIETDVLRQVLLTVGFAFLFQQAALDIWGGDNMDIKPVAALNTSLVIGGVYFPAYRAFMIATALAIGIVIWLVMEKTRMGAAVRATVDDAQMARGVGIDTNRVSMFIFALGAFLAALGGVIGGAFLGIYPGLDFEMLPLAFAVVIIGGMGSLGGAAIGALAVGLADNFGKALFPEISYFTLYAPMVLILAVKPTGLFGRE